MKKKAIFKLVLVLMAYTSSVFSQDSIRCTLEQAEESFIKKNLLLLAEQFNIEKQKALELQAKAYPNPTFYANFNVYDPEHDIFFHVDDSGQKDFMFEQLILLGGKRKTSIEIARKNKEIAEAEFADLMRNLMYQLHQSFFRASRFQNNIVKSTLQMAQLDTLIGSYEMQADKGNLAMKDVIRIKSIYLKINNERSEYLQLLAEEQKNLKLLTQLQGIIYPDVKTEYLEKCTKEVKLSDIESAAFSQRPDLIISDKMNQISALNYKLQKRMVIPDPAVNVSTDQRGGAFHNQINAGLAFPIPIWNLNRGNIKAAKSDIQMSSYLFEQRKKEIQAEVLEAFQNMIRSVGEYKKSKQLYNSNFDFVFKSVNENFAKKNMSIIEFTDFFEAYSDALQEFERIKSQIAISAAKINYVSGTKIFN